MRANAARGDGRHAGHHRDEGKVIERLEVTSRPVNRDNAQKRQGEQLETFRRGHKGKNPKYNETDEG